MPSLVGGSGGGGGSYTLPDADGTTKGGIVLTGDLGNTAATPRVVTVNGKAVSAVLFSDNAKLANILGSGITDADVAAGAAIAQSKVSGLSTSLAGKVGTSFVPQNALTKTANYTAVAGDLIFADASGGAFAITLPSASSSGAGARIRIRKTDTSANAVTITGTIDGAVNPTLTVSGAAVEIISDGTTWRDFIGDQSISTRRASDLLRSGGWMPTGAIDETVPLRLTSTNSNTPASGVLNVAGGILLPGGRAVSSISVMSHSTAGASLTHLWFCLVDKNLNVLATTLDDTSGSWSANTVKTLSVASALGGAVAGTYTPTSEIEAFLGVCEVGTTPASIKAAAGNSNLAAQTPVTGGTSTTGLTTPASLGATAGAITAIANIMYGWVS